MKSWKLYILLVFLPGCLSLSPHKCQEVSTPSTEAELAEHWIDRKNYDQALENLNSMVKKDSENESTYHQIGRVYSSMGDIDESSKFYSKALHIKSSYNPSYIALRDISKFKLIQVRKDIEIAKEGFIKAKRKGQDTIKNYQKNLNDLYQKQAKIYIEQAKTYLKYENPELNVTEFPEIEAHLRDVQDMIKEIEETNLIQKEKGIDINTEHLNLLDELKKMRSEISKKHTSMLMVLGAKFIEEDEIDKALDCLKDADAQMGKFFEEEDPTSQVSLLIPNEEVLALSKN